MTLTLLILTLLIYITATCINKVHKSFASLQGRRLTLTGLGRSCRQGCCGDHSDSDH